MSAEEISGCGTERQATIQYVNIAVAIAIWVVFSFFQRRVSFYRRSCKGIPGIVYPLDPVHTSCYRIVYLIAYGAVAGEIIKLVMNTGSTYGLKSIWAASLISILHFVEASVVYFPLFACVDAPVPVVGYITGLLFVPLLFYRQIATPDVLCLQRNDTESDYEEQLANGLSFTLPILTFLFVMFLWYLLSAVKEVHRLVVTPLRPFINALFEHKTTSYHVKHVKSLLKRPTCTTHHKLIHRLLSFLYPYDSNVQLPLRFLAAVVIMIYAVYLLTVQLSFLTVKLSILLKMISEKHRIKILADSLYALRVVFPAGPILAFAWNLVIMLFMIRAVRIHLQKLACGDLSFLSSSIPSPSYRLLNSMKYTSYQTAFFIWSWILACIVVWLMGLAGLGIYYLLQIWRDEILLSFAASMIPVIYSLILNYVELLLVKVLFVGDTDNRHTVLRNRRLFYVFSYFLFFQNVVVGFVSSFLRIIFSVVLGLVLFFRLDRVVLMKGFEALDQGHATYVSFLYVEHTQNNSILHVFKDICAEFTNGSNNTEMKQLNNGADIQNFYQSFDESRTPMVLFSRRARNRWLLAYTLLKNPMLQSLRTRSEDLVDKEVAIC